VQGHRLEGKQASRFGLQHAWDLGEAGVNLVIMWENWEVSKEQSGIPSNMPVSWITWPGCYAGLGRVRWW